MESVLLALRIGLAVMFFVAAIVKLADQAAFRQTVVAFGLPSKGAGGVAAGVVLAEFAVAVLLLWADTTWWGAVGSLLLLLLFTVAIAVNLARGNRPPCQCFGQLHSTPISKATLWRNIMLVAGAAVIALPGPGHVYVGATSWLRSNEVLPFLVVALTAAVVIEGWLVFHLLRQHGRLLLSIDNLELRLDAGGVQGIVDSKQWMHGLPVGSTAPAFDLPLFSGGRSTLDALLQAQHPLLLIFSDPQCNPCTALLPDVAMWEVAHAHELSIALVSRGTVDENRPKIADSGITRVLLQKSRELAELYRVQATPSAVLVNAAGLIDAPLAVGAVAIAQLVTRVATERAAAEPIASKKEKRAAIGVTAAAARL